MLGKVVDRIYNCQLGTGIHIKIKVVTQANFADCLQQSSKYPFKSNWNIKNGNIGLS